MSDDETRMWMKERVKKDNHNISMYPITHSWCVFVYVCVLPAC